MIGAQISEVIGGPEPDVVRVVGDVEDGDGLAAGVHPADHAVAQRDGGEHLPGAARRDAPELVLHMQQRLDQGGGVPAEHGDRGVAGFYRAAGGSQCCGNIINDARKGHGAGFSLFVRGEGLTAAKLTHRRRVQRPL